MHVAQDGWFRAPPCTKRSRSGARRGPRPRRGVVSDARPASTSRMCMARRRLSSPGTVPASSSRQRSFPKRSRKPGSTTSGAPGDLAGQAARESTPPYGGARPAGSPGAPLPSSQASAPIAMAFETRYDRPSRGCIAFATTSSGTCSTTLHNPEFSGVIGVDPAVDDDDYDGFVAEALVGRIAASSRRARGSNMLRAVKGHIAFLVPSSDPNELAHGILAALFKTRGSWCRIEAHIELRPRSWTSCSRTSI